MKQWIHTIKKSWSIWLFALLAFLLYSSLYFPYEGILNSPDETSNYFFALHFLQEGNWKYHVPLNTEVGYIIHPRSIFVSGEYLIPGSFLGMPFFYALIGKLFGSWVILFLTPFFTCLAAFCFYRIIKKFFSPSVAYLSFFLFLLHPAIWYYSARTMMHNMLFIDLLIIGLYFLIIHTQKWWAYICAAFFLAFSVATRTSEIVWLLFAAFILYLFSFKQVSWKYVFLFIFSVIIFFFPVLHSYKSIYGKYCLSSYTCQQEIVQIGQASSQSQEENTSDLHEEEPSSIHSSIFEKDLIPTDSFLRLLFPFGIVLKKTWVQIRQYGINIIWYLFIPAVLGWVLLCKRRYKEKFFWAYTLLSLSISLWLFLYYGSWEFVDNINFWEVTLGNSFVRYFLPYYIFLIPLAAVFFLEIKKYSRGIFMFLMALILFLIFEVTLWGSTEGLLQTKKYLYENFDKRNQVLSYISVDAILITERQDKLFFPDRMVVYDFFENPSIARQIESLLSYRDVYYFTYRPLRDITYMNQTYLKEMGYHIQEQEITIGDQFLYKVEK